MRSARLLRRFGLVLVPAVLIAAAGVSLSGASFERADAAFCNGAEPSSLDPQQGTGMPETRLVRALYEGLVVSDPRTGMPIPGMAESWSTSADGLTWTFRIRAGSRWTDGAEVTAHDFAFAWERLLDPRTGAQYADLLFVVRGARAWAEDVGEDGAPTRTFASNVAITALDARTFVVGLEHPVDHFLALAVAAPLVPVSRHALEAARARWPDRWQVEWTKPEHSVTNGPFRLVERRINDRIRLAKHEGYWDADEVAFRTLDVLASEHLATNLNFYLTGEVAYLDEVPVSAIPRLRGREDYRPAPYLGSSFFRVNVAKPPLDDVRVRRALALAIDRQEIADKITKAGELPSFSLVPKLFAGWTGAELRRSGSLADDLDEARQLLTEAGYGPTRPLPPIELHFASQATNKDVCEVIADFWRKELGITARLRNQEWKVYLDAQRRLEYDISRSSWIADFADPATFLEVFAPGADNSRTGWSDARYGDLLERARRAREPERFAILAEAEALLLTELPILPVYTFTVTSLVDPRLGGFHANPLDDHCPKFWYWKPDAELAESRAGNDPAIREVESHGPREGLLSPAEQRRRASR